MHQSKSIGILFAGLIAGAVNGLFGAGGGMILVPLLSLLNALDDTEIFPTSISIILPICIVSLTVTGLTQGIAWHASIPYLFGSAVGGVLSGFFGKKIPVKWLHRGLGILIIWGGFRYLC